MTACCPLHMSSSVYVLICSVYVDACMHRLIYHDVLLAREDQIQTSLKPRLDLSNDKATRFISTNGDTAVTRAAADSLRLIPSKGVMDVSAITHGDVEHTTYCRFPVCYCASC